MPRVKTMTAKMRAFADGILSGKEPSPAYVLAYPDCRANKRTIARKAHKLSNHPEIMAYIAQERAKIADEQLLTRKEAVGILAKIAKGKDRGATHRDKIAAVAQASKMLGYDVPTKVEVKLEGSLLHKIRNG